MDKITPIGVTNYQNKNIPFGIKKKDRAGHIYCIGKTGSGKSTLLLNMAVSDIRSGEGVTIIDPHGDIAEEILQHIPRERINDVIYFNAGDREYPLAFNPLYNVKREDRYTVASTIVITLKKVWKDSWGPRLEHILRNTLLSLTHHPESTLLDITPMLTNYEFRKKVLYAVDDYSLHEFWQKEFEPLSPQLKNEVISPIINKVGLFTAHPLLKNILGQKISTIDIAKIMDSQQILIVNLSKGSLGEAGTQLLGSLLITQFQTASLQRAKQTIDLRKPYYLFIDEMHSFMTLSFADILSESRKYGLSLFLTHQFIDQVDEDILKAILGNVGTLISFRIGASDALVLKTEFYPVFNEIDLVNLPRYCIYLKLLIDGTTSQPFSAITLPPQPITGSFKEKIIELSRKKYGKERGLVEKNIFERYRRPIETNKEQGLFD
jgi:hypothetical protein